MSDVNRLDSQPHRRYFLLFSENTPNREWGECKPIPFIGIDYGISSCTINIRAYELPAKRGNQLTGNFYLTFYDDVMCPYGTSLDSSLEINVYNFYS